MPLFSDSEVLKLASKCSQAEKTVTDPNRKQSFPQN